LSDSAVVHSILGIDALNHGSVDHGLVELQEALRIDPNLASAHWHLGRALAPRAKTDAMQHLRRAVELAPDNMAARYDLAVALLEAGHDDEALRHFKVALPSMPDAALAYNGLGVALASHGRFADAVEQLREAVRLKPTYVEAYNNLGTALASQGKREEAVAQFERALTLRPEYAEARRNLGIVQRGVPH
jgi:Flp pilus assembly protein TadD